MAGIRRYKLLCPIARALDRVGDRWTLLILRDLHAGPARYSDLQSGLAGIASNLLTDRLQQLIDNGLVVKRDGEYGVTLYALTDLGARTSDLLFELAMFGSRFQPDEELRRPGNLRTIVVTLRTAIQRISTSDVNFDAELVVDGECFALSIHDGAVDMRAGAAQSPDVVLGLKPCRADKTGTRLYRWWVVGVPKRSQKAVCRHAEEDHFDQECGAVSRCRERG